MKKKSVAEKLCVIFPIITAILIVLIGIVAFIIPREIVKNVPVEEEIQSNVPPQNEWMIPYTPVSFEMSNNEVISMLGKPYNIISSGALQYKCTYLEKRGNLDVYLELDDGSNKRIAWRYPAEGDTALKNKIRDTLKELYGTPAKDSSSKYRGSYYWETEKFICHLGYSKDASGTIDKKDEIVITYYESGAFDYRKF